MIKLKRKKKKDLVLDEELNEIINNTALNGSTKVRNTIKFARELKKQQII